MAELGSRVVAWSPWVALEGERALGGAMRLSVGVSTASARVPAPGERGPIFKALFAPDLAVTAGAARAHAVSGAVSGRGRYGAQRLG